MGNVYESPQSNTTRAHKDEGLVTDELVKNIRRGGSWAKFLSVMSYIFFGFLVIAVIAIAISLVIAPLDEISKQLGESFGDISTDIIMIGMIVYLVVLLIMGTLTFLTARAYGRYGRASSELEGSHDPEGVLESFGAFTLLMKYIMVMLIITIVLAFSAGIIFSMIGLES